MGVSLSPRPAASDGSHAYVPTPAMQYRLVLECHISTATASQVPGKSALSTNTDPVCLHPVPIESSQSPSLHPFRLPQDKIEEKQDLLYPVLGGNTGTQRRKETDPEGGCQ